MPKTVASVLDLARAQIGYTEEPPGSNRTKFGTFFGFDGVPWCAMFVYWVLTKRAVETIKSAYTPAVAQWYRDQKRGFTDEKKIEPGDLLFFNFPDSLDRIQHIAFAQSKWMGDHVRTIEGNTSSGTSGSQDNGGGVFERVRYAPEIVYIGRPFYAEEVKLPRFVLPKERTYLRLGDKGADVRALQRDLNQWMRVQRRKGAGFDYGELPVDGVFSKELKKALQTFQKMHPKLEPDGQFGRETERVLDRQRQAA